VDSAEHEIGLWFQPNEVWNEPIQFIINNKISVKL
jgi:hypothetical protein